MLNRKLAVALAAALIHAPLALGQTTTWRVAAGEDPRITTPGVPAGTSLWLADILYGDVGRGQIGFRVVTPDSLAGYWASVGSTFARYAQLGATGNTGPGRGGAEAGNVFLNIYTGGSGAAPDGQRVFLGRAGDAASPATASYGLWRWDGVRNVEVARTLVGDPLGPGLGAGWTFPNSSSFTDARAYGSAGYVLLDADVSSPTGASGHALIRHAGGTNQPCLRTGATEAALAPGLSAGDSFQNSWSMAGNLSVSSSGRVYGSFEASGSRSGIWEVCAGAPRAVAVNNETGARGPAIGLATATFASGFQPPYPALPGQFYFFTYYRRTAGATTQYGLFQHDGTANRPIAYQDDVGYYGPNWIDATWRTFNEDSLSAGGEYSGFSASMTTTDGGNPTGFWRVRAGQRPQLVALIGIPGQYGPEPNRTWRAFGASAVLSNGDVVLEARTDPGDITGLWLLEAGRAPRKMLEVGQAITVPTTTGTQSTTVTSFDLPGSGSDHGRGRDRWMGADGTLLVTATVANYGTVLLTTQASDRIFRNGID
ncbi:MAG TPA: hypothetical protein VM847_15280 [Tahibacter sp.]|nr:hypothetical protein [Tahibacter sp.]